MLFHNGGMQDLGMGMGFEPLAAGQLPELGIRAGFQSWLTSLIGDILERTSRNSGVNVTASLD